jgi:putative RecB family exonuclease
MNSLALAPAVPASCETGSQYLSYSAISTYQQCPLKFMFKYVLGLPQETITASLLFGQAMHRAAQFHFEQLLARAKPPSLDTLVDVFWQAWHGRTQKLVVFNNTEDLDSICHLADRLLWAFQESDFAYPEGTILGVEEGLRGELVPGLPDMVARVDLLVDTGDTLVLSDFKTSRSAWTEEHVSEAAPQLLLYSELVRHLSDGRPLKLQFAVLTKTKSPVLSLHPVVADPLQIERSKRVVEHVWQAIEGQHFYPVPSPLNCPSCPFQEPCKRWAG